MGVDCQYGLRQRTYNVLSGSVLSVWNKVESVLSSNYGGKMQVRLEIEINQSSF